MTAKEIWYVWSGQGHPPVGVKKALCQCMVLIDDEKYLGSIESACDWSGDRHFIQLYTLGETRKRVQCHSCLGTGHHLIRSRMGGGISYTYNRCRKCTGRGYIWRVRQCMR